MRKAEYPHCTLKDAIHLAEIVDRAGGKTKMGVVADQLNMAEKGGAFNMKVNGTVKYGLLEKNGDELKVTDLGDRIMHPTNDYERDMALLDAVRHVPIFDKIILKFNEREIHKNYLTNILIREFEISKNFATRVSYYFFKANEIANFLKPLKKGVFGLRDDVVNNEADIEIEEGESEEDVLAELKYQSNSQKISKINEETFSIIYNLGNFTNDPSRSIKEIAQLLQLESVENQFSHFRLLFDFVATQFNEGTIDAEKIKSSLPKLVEAIKKDLKI